ncbi:hypothetical protein HELRODRAFT_94851 [Helobdella robusta]|uniref:DNA 3'-5' helicase n=1 Tax=Helobdella robusta TaxID=6412 RepID=T1G935_HELRO|nr:hypothetical protein HELRODRAFT_94851 [Helobdella robusta]ESN98669.1 hypothetical protein HELRODRAFT_94851 [Helobdella robusta]
MRILCGQSTMVVLSTGSGKSLCYQLPAYMYAYRSRSLCLVISPLVSLMQDQVVMDLPACLKGACIHNNMTPDQRSKVIESAISGDLHFLLLSPEMLVGGSIFGDNGKFPPISFVCIDEVHCLSEWSHHFRPSYLMVCKTLRERFGVSVMLGLTATANKSTIRSVCQNFNIPEHSVVMNAPVPTNLMITVSRDEDKDEMLIQLLKGRNFSGCSSIIVYCTRREETERVATIIRTPRRSKPTQTRKKKSTKALGLSLAWSAECYHAGMTPAHRKRVQKQFMAGKLRVIVATVAFGMGLDKRDIRGVIHYNFPRTIESYVQEIGRAGRDGGISYCHLFLDPTGSDLRELKRHIHARSLDRITIKKFVLRVFQQCSCLESDGADDVIKVLRRCFGHERALSIEELVNKLDVKEEGLSTLLCYLELHDCRYLRSDQPTYNTCVIRFYSSVNILLDVVKKCPVLGMLLTKRPDLLSSAMTSRIIEFDVIQLADDVGVPSYVIKRQLRDLQFINDHNGCRRSGIIVEFSNLCYRYRCRGDFSDDEIDGIVDFLFERVDGQERTEMYLLYKFYDMLKSASYKTCYSCGDEDGVDEERIDSLRLKLQHHMENSSEHVISREKLLETSSELATPQELSSLRSDIRNFINTYMHDHMLTGRCIARIFHGIDSPCFPTQVWSKVRRYWRCSLHIDFNIIRVTATQELINWRR